MKILNQSFIISVCESNTKHNCVMCNSLINENDLHPYIAGQKIHFCSNIDCQKNYIIRDINKQIESK